MRLYCIMASLSKFIYSPALQTQQNLFSQAQYLTRPKYQQRFLVYNINNKINPLINLSSALSNMHEQSRKFGADIQNISVNHHHIVLKSRPFSFENRKKVYEETNHNNSRIGVLRNFIKKQSDGISNPVRASLHKKCDEPSIQPACNFQQSREPIIRENHIEEAVDNEQQYWQIVKQNLQLVPSHLKTCLKYVKQISQQSPSCISGIRTENPAYVNHRRIDTLDWLIGMGESMSLYPETVSLAIHYIDRFMSKKPTQQTDYLLISLAALRAAAKIEQSYADITARRFIRTAKIKAEIKQLVAMEDQIVNTLQFNLVYDSPVKHLQLFSRITDTSNKNECICMYYLQLTTLSLSYLEYSPLVLASSIFCVMQKLRKVSPAWPTCLIQLTGYEEEQMSKCTKFVQTIVDNEQLKSDATNIVKKYSSQEYCSVATMKLHRKLQ